MMLAIRASMSPAIPPRDRPANPYSLRAKADEYLSRMLVVFPWFNMVNHKFHNTEQDCETAFFSLPRSRCRAPLLTETPLSACALFPDYKGLEHLKPADYSAIY